MIQDITGVVGGKPHWPAPDELGTQRTEPVATPIAIPTEPPPHEPEPVESPGKKSPNFLIGAVIAVAIAIVVGWALWFTGEPRQRERVVEPPVAKAPEAPQKPKEVPTPEVFVTTSGPGIEAPIQRAFTNSIGMKFVLILEGSFVMGSRLAIEELLRRFGGEKGWYEWEKPSHSVRIKRSFYLQSAPVTQGQWQRLMGNNPSHFKDCGENCPVEKVSWEDARQFIKKLNEVEKTEDYRLPSEAEWEYACQGSSDAEFSFGDEVERLYEFAWYSKNSGDKTHPVGDKEPNGWGLYDMHGNVWEWVEDDWHDSYEGAPDDGRAWIDSPRGSARVIRGGGWYNDALVCRSAFRASLWSESRYSLVGFRLSRSVALGPKF